MRGEGGGTNGSARAIFQRTTSVSSAVSIGYTFSRTFVVDPSVAVHTLFAGWRYSPRTSSLSISLFGGASRWEAEGLPATTSPVANASISGALTSSTAAGLSYRRQFSVPRGFGRSLLIDYFNANLAQQIGARISAGVMAGASFASQPLDESLQRNTRRVGGRLSIRLIGGLRLGTSYFYTETEQRRALSTVDNERKNWSVHLNYSTDW